MLFKAEDAFIRRDRATIEENTPLVLPNRSISAKNRSRSRSDAWSSATDRSTYAVAAARIYFR
jgi:hypothetical protein